MSEFTTRPTTQPRSWMTSERVLAGLGGFLIVIAVLTVLGSIVTAAERDAGTGNFLQTSAMVLGAVAVGIAGGAVSQIATRRRTARGVVLADA